MKFDIFTWPTGYDLQDNQICARPLGRQSRIRNSSSLSHKIHASHFSRPYQFTAYTYPFTHHSFSSPFLALNVLAIHRTFHSSLSTFIHLLPAPSWPHISFWLLRQQAIKHCQNRLKMSLFPKQYTFVRHMFFVFLSYHKVMSSWTCEPIFVNRHIVQNSQFSIIESTAGLNQI